MSMSKSIVDKLSTVIQDEVNMNVGYLKGRILTILDASIQDPEQRKALKDLVKQEIEETRWGRGFIPQTHYVFLHLAEKIGDKEFVELVKKWPTPQSRSAETDNIFDQ